MVGGQITGPEGGPLVALVHGGLHGAWCWDLLAPELHSRGYRTVAPDMPVSEPGLGADVYADAVAAAVPEDEEIVVVGHSMGGLVIPLLADRRGVRGLVFLAAMIPAVGKSLAEQYAVEPDAVGQANVTFGADEVGRLTVDADGARRLFFHDCPESVVDWAVPKLVPQATDIVTETSPLTAWPAVPSASIVCREDRAVPFDWAVRAARTRLDTEAVLLDGSHSPFASRPADTASALDAIVRKRFGVG